MEDKLKRVYEFYTSSVPEPMKKLAKFCEKIGGKFRYKGWIVPTQARCDITNGDIKVSLEINNPIPTRGNKEGRKLQFELSIDNRKEDSYYEVNIEELKDIEINSRDDLNEIRVIDKNNDSKIYMRFIGKKLDYLYTKI